MHRFGFAWIELDLHFGRSGTNCARGAEHHSPGICNCIYSRLRADLEKGDDRTLVASFLVHVFVICVSVAWLVGMFDDQTAISNKFAGTSFCFFVVAQSTIAIMALHSEGLKQEFRSGTREAGLDPPHSTDQGVKR